MYPKSMSEKILLGESHFSFICPLCNRLSYCVINIYSYRQKIINPCLQLLNAEDMTQKIKDFVVNAGMSK